MKKRQTWYFHKSKTHSALVKEFVGVWTGVDPNRSKLHKKLLYEISRFNSPYVTFGCQTMPDGLDFGKNKTNDTH